MLAHTTNLNTQSAPALMRLLDSLSECALITSNCLLEGITTRDTNGKLNARAIAEKIADLEAALFLAKRATLTSEQFVEERKNMKITRELYKLEHQNVQTNHPT